MARLILALFAAAMLQSAAAQQQARPVPDRDIYGAQMMTPEERDAYRRRLAAAQTPQERERVEREHRERMIERSKARGIKLPDQPARRGR